MTATVMYHDGTEQRFDADQWEPAIGAATFWKEVDGHRVITIIPYERVRMIVVSE